MENQGIDMTRVLKMPKKRKNEYNLDDEWDTNPKKKKRGNNQTTGFYQHGFEVKNFNTNYFFKYFIFQIFSFFIKRLHLMEREKQLKTLKCQTISHTINPHTTKKRFGITIIL